MITFFRYKYNVITVNYTHYITKTPYELCNYIYTNKLHCKETPFSN